MRKPLPVLLTFDLDDELSTRNAARNKASGITDPEMGRFGLTKGYRTLLDILDQYGVHGSFFVIGDSLRRYPDTIENIIKAGHEIGNHSFSHRSYSILSKEEIFEEIHSTNQAILNLIGKHPMGHRSPYWAPNEQLTGVLEQLGFTWNSDAHTQLEENIALPLSWRTESILEVPSSIAQGDWTNFLVKKRSPEEVLSLWCQRLNLARKTSNIFTLVCHPFIIGRSEYQETLSQFVAHVLESHDDFQIMTGENLVKEQMTLRHSPDPLLS